MSRFVVKSRPESGYALFFRAGRGWPIAGTVVEVVDEEFEGTKGPGKDGVVAISRKTLAVLQAEARLHVAPEGSDVDEAEALKARVAELEKEVDELEKENGALKQRLQKLLAKAAEAKKPEGQAAPDAGKPAETPAAK